MFGIDSVINSIFIRFLVILSMLFMAPHVSALADTSASVQTPTADLPLHAEPISASSDSNTVFFFRVASGPHGSLAASAPVRRDWPGRQRDEIQRRAVAPDVARFERKEIAVGNRLIFDLFDGETCVAVVTSINRYSGGAPTYIASVESYPLSHAIISIANGNLFGTLSLVERKKYFRISKPHGETGYTLDELDRTKFDVLPGGPSLTPPAPPVGQVTTP